MCAEYVSPRVKTYTDTSHSPDYSQYEDDAVEEEPAVRPSSTNPGIKQCSNDKDVCYSVWRMDENGTRTIEVQGCWSNLAKQSSCDDLQCVSHRQHASPHAHRFCCCASNMCNTNMTEDSFIDYHNQIPIPIAPESPAVETSSFLSSIRSEKLWLIVCMIVTPLVFSLLYVTLCRAPTKPNPDTTVITAPPNPKYSTDLLNVDNLKLCSMIGQGKYGTVWKGMINEQCVAVKIFPAQYKQYFLNERDIYCLPLMQTQYLLEYYGCDERRTLEDNIEYLLVLSLAPLGCLQEWLMENTSTFNVFVNMAKSIARGLAHLHTEMNVGALSKPCICHRDLNSRNILVKSDLTCSISDFGFALKTFGSRYEWKGEITLAERKSMNEVSWNFERNFESALIIRNNFQVGTIRYLAPELLEGAVNLRDCETALKQTDIYSLGLVLWELCTRCHDWYAPGQLVPPYRLPYEAEVGKMPSFEQMQVLVSRQKVRPAFPPGWGGDAAAKIARDTCDDCMDHDAEARLTAVCIEERIREISTLRPHSIIFSPTSQRSMSDAKLNDEIITISEISNEAVPSTASNTASKRNKTVVDRLNEAKLMGWNDMRLMIHNKLSLQPKEDDEKSILVDDHRRKHDTLSAPLTKTIVKSKHLPQIRPNNLDLTFPHSNLALCASEGDQSTRNYQSVFKRPPGDFSKQRFVVVDEATQRDRLKPCIVVSKSANAVKSLQNAEPLADDLQLKRQRSLEVFRDVFGVKGSVEQLRNPSDRIKTPGDVPKSVRKVRASKTLSLYDDRMMNATGSAAGNSL